MNLLTKLKIPLSSPFLHRSNSIRMIMLEVLLALLPGIFVYYYFFGPAIIIQLMIATLVAIISELPILWMRKKPILLFITDGSAIVTAWLLVLAIPPFSPWWMTALSVFIAIAFVKHLYGGLGQNIFNPAMAAWCIMIIAFPKLMSQWPYWDSTLTSEWLSKLNWQEAFQAIFQKNERLLIDAISTATPLDSLRTQLTLSTHIPKPIEFHWLTLEPYHWISLMWALGGLWLIVRKIISWHIPFFLLASLLVVAGIANLVNPEQYAPASFHLLNGAAIIGAFLIATDPVSAANTPRGKIIYAISIALLTWIIRTWGGYPDAIAFSIIIMNMTVPLLDRFNQPAIFGHKS